MENNKLTRFEKLSGISLILFPIMLLIGFVMHPDLFQFKIVHTAQQLADNFRGQWIFHVGHLIVALAIPFIIISLFYCGVILKDKGAKLGFIGGVIGLFGAVILALDKGSLCLVLSGFDTLSDADFAGLIPYLQVLVDKPGLLAINWLISLLPLGAILQAVGMIKEGYFKKAQGMSVIIGLLLLNNPDIEIISTVGAVLMCIGYIPFGIKTIKESKI